jgi:hypothetical protein
MAVTYHIDPEERIVYLITAGESPSFEWRAAMLSVLADPDYRPGFNFLSDRRRQTNVPDAQYVRPAADFLAYHSAKMGSYRWASVSTDPATFGMLRMFEAFARTNGVRARAFTDYDQALRWLRGQED